MEKINSRQLQAQATRLKITKAAIQLLKSKPYDNIKITDICRLANISVGGFYHYFDSKEKIVIDAYNIIDESVMKKYNKKKFDSPIDSILYLNECIAKTTTELGCELVSNCYRQLLVDDSNYTSSPNRLVHKELELELSRAIAMNLIKSLDIHALSEYLSKIARGNIFDWCIKRGSFDLVEVLKREINDLLTLFIIR